MTYYTTMAQLQLNILFVLVIGVIDVINAQRRIENGHTLNLGKGYAVYLLKTNDSLLQDEAWVCGGAIVNEWFIITSAACVEEVEYMYAIAGSVNYIHGQELDLQTCTVNEKRKIVFTCVPRAYNLEHQYAEVWSYIDIAVVKVERKYTFANEPPVGCTHRISPVPINYEAKHQEPGVEVIIMGWGHKEKWRMPNDFTNYNQKNLQYASTLIFDKEVCKKYFPDAFAVTIDKYMVCTNQQGNLDDRGYQLRVSKPIGDGCEPILDPLKGGYTCEANETVLIDETRRSIDAGKIWSRTPQRIFTRRQGICQNDHGGPLIAFVGGRETLIGVASVFLVTNTSACIGPNLFTSTQCNGAFLDCIVHSLDTRRKNYNCDRPPSETGYISLRRTISWEKHPHGPAENERIMEKASPPFDVNHPWRRR